MNFRKNFGSLTRPVCGWYYLKGGNEAGGDGQIDEQAIPDQLQSCLVLPLLHNLVPLKNGPAYLSLKKGAKSPPGSQER